MSRSTVARRSAASLGALLLVALLVPTGEAIARDEARVPSRGDSVLASPYGSYVVIMKDDPLVATFAVDELDTAAAKNRGQQLRASHSRALKALPGGVQKIHDYTVALNGFSALLSQAQAEQLAARKDVLLVLPDELQQAQTDSSPQFLGLTGSGGAHSSGVRGQGVVVGVIDTGIWPEHPSFADDGSYRSPIKNLPCEFGNTAANPADAPFTCNDKLIGADQVLDTYRAVLGADPDEFDSARDDDGHGTHTASTAAGNAGVAASIKGRNVGVISGIAPRAHVIAYKALGNQGGFGSDLAAAIDEAVEQGVDVINYSIGGGAGLTGPDDIAFLFAADAGVHVATSAGNSGPGPATIGGPASVPWLTAVGANTQSRFFKGTVTLGSGATFTGAAIYGNVGSSPLVDAADVARQHDDLCQPGTLDARKVSGAIVLCRRGVVGRVEKSKEVFDAGGVGMIMYENNNIGNLFTDTHWVPTVHVDNAPGLAIKGYIDAATGSNPATASITTDAPSTWPSAPSMTDFSSRGPDPVAEDIIKPDITAPGIQILAGNSPFPDPGMVPDELFQAIAGTSMSSPHIAGMLALIDQQHPSWSAAAAKSAMMTTANTDVRDNDRTSQATPFEMGAGQVKPGGPSQAGSMFQPGLVYDAGFNDYLGFLCDEAPEVFANPTATCTSLANAGVPTEAHNLNYPSIGVAAVPGRETVTRTVTSVASSRRTYTVSVQEPEGYDIAVSPSTFTISPGHEQTYTVTITNETAPIGEFRFGSLTWTSGAYNVRSPIAVRGAKFAAPEEITGTGVNGSASFEVTFGYSGAYTARAHGLEPATLTVDNVLQDPDQSFDPSDVRAGGANAHEFDLSGVAHFRIAIPPEATEPDADLDVYVFDPNGDLVASSTLGGTDEQVDLSEPADGTWTVYVHGWQAPGGDSDYTMYSWAISGTPGGNLTIDSAPSAAVKNETATIQVSWTGATAGEWHLGAVSHNDATGRFGLTLVEVDNR
ncbi:MAG TPA: S8 family serine peptidase [Actinomycetota bacterium]|jgi:subtilisin family serine protease|nr:S8 family serine peptidase [Actinomycetota bacterium]